MAAVEQLITQNLDIWSSAIKTRSSAGRGSSNKLDLYGIKKLRALILELAVRGLLVAQDPSDEPASVLLERVGAKKAFSIKDNIIRNPKRLPEISENEKPFMLPQGWVYSRFIDVLDFSGGSQPPKSTFSDEKLAGYVQLIQIRDLGPEPQPVYVPVDKVSKFCTKDDVMIGRYGASVGKVFWGKEGAYNVALVKLNNDLKVFQDRFLYMLMLSPVGQSFFSGISRSAQAGFSKNDIADRVVPIPPEAEQPRIVAKVDELMALCDQLEQQQESSISAHQTLVEALLAALVNAGEKDEFNQAWTRIAEHFDTLFTTEHSIDQLKQTILQLAVMGKLVPQDPNDEPASVLLEKIAAEKAQLIKDKEIRRQKIQIINAGCHVYDLPKGWSWAQLGELSASDDNAMCDGPFGSKLKTEHYIAGKGFAVVRLGNIGVGKFLWGKEGQITKEHYETLKNNHLLAGDLIVAGMAEPIIRCCEVPPTLGPAVNKADCFKLRVHEYLEKKYICHYLNSPASKLFAAEENQGMTRQRINLGKCKAIPVPIPPIKEQYRIIAKVDALMALCDSLKTSINKSQTTQFHLADAMAERAIN